MIDNIQKLVRPFVALCFVGTTVFLAVTGKIDPKEMLSITAIIVAFYFAERATLKKTGE